MKRLKRRYFTVAVAAAMVAMGATRLSATVNLDYVGYGPSQTVDLEIKHGTTTENINNAVAGFYNIKIDGKEYKTFCIDIADRSGDDPKAEIVSLASAPDAISPDTWAGPMGDLAADTIMKLWASHYSDALANADGTGLYAAALQIAIWMAIDKEVGGYTVTFSDNKSATDLADDWLDALGDKNALLKAVVSPCVQDYIVPVPEPTTLIAGALLLLPFGASAVRTLRRRS